MQENTQHTSTTYDETAVFTKIFRGGAWLYASTLTNNLAGFLYWLIISKIATSATLGTTSAIVSIAFLATSLTSLGLPYGIQKFIGETIGSKDPQNMQKYYSTALTFTTATTLLVTATLLLLSTTPGWANITPKMLQLAALLYATLSLASIPQAFLVSHLKTHIVFASTLIGNILRIATGTLLVLQGLDWTGATIGYITAPLTTLTLTLAYSTKITPPKPKISAPHLHQLLKAGTATWTPNAVAVAGQWLAVLSVYGATTPQTTGHFYIAFTIANATIFMTTSILQLLLPVLSSLKDGRKRSTNKVLNTTLALTTPLAALIAAKPQPILQLLGKNYTASAPQLQIIMTSLPFIALTTATTSLLYTYNKYRHITTIGLAQNIPRIIAYTALTPLLGPTGTSIAYTIGSITGAATALHYAKKTNYHPQLKTLALITLTPTLLAAATQPLPPQALPLILLSYPIYLKQKIISKHDLTIIGKILIPLKTK